MGGEAREEWEGLSAQRSSLILLLYERVGGAAQVAGAAGKGGGAGVGGSAGFAGALLGALPPLGHRPHQGWRLDVLSVLFRFLFLVVPLVVIFCFTVVRAGVAGNGGGWRH